MEEFLGNLIVRLIPVAIPAALIYSFLMNHGMAPSGGEKKKEKKDKKAEGDKGTDASEPPKE